MLHTTYESRPCLLAVVACFFTRDPRSTSLSAKPHGRVGLLVKAGELALTVVYALPQYFGSSMQLGICVIFAVGNLYVNVAYLPFYKPISNTTTVMHAMLFTSGTVFLGVAMLRGVPQVQLRGESEVDDFPFKC